MKLVVKAVIVLAAMAAICSLVQSNGYSAPKPRDAPVDRSPGI